MIKDVKKSIFSTDITNIAFIMNAERQVTTDLGELHELMKRYKGDLQKNPEAGLGDIVSFPIGERTFHAMICYSYESKAWKKAPAFITQALDKINSGTEPIAVLLPHVNAALARTEGANSIKMIQAIHASAKDCVVCTGNYEPDHIWEILGKK